MKKLRKTKTGRPWATPTPDSGLSPFLHRAACRYVGVEIHYEYYLEMARREQRRIAAHESTPIPARFAYRGVGGLSHAAVERFERVQPQSIGQAGRIAGITPADMACLLVAVRKSRTP